MALVSMIINHYITAIDRLIIYHPIYIPGNIVRACGTSGYTPGTFLYASGNGMLCDKQNSTERPMAIVRSTFATATTNMVGKVILI